jgi:hypothetical protein
MTIDSLPLANRGSIETTPEAAPSALQRVEKGFSK